MGRYVGLLLEGESTRHWVAGSAFLHRMLPALEAAAQHSIATAVWTEETCSQDGFRSVVRTQPLLTFARAALHCCLAAGGNPSVPHVAGENSSRHNRFLSLWHCSLNTLM